MSSLNQAKPSRRAGRAAFWSLLAAGVAGTIGGCGAEPTVDEGSGESLGAHASPLTIPGPWNPPASTKTIAATQYVSVVGPPNIAPLGSCSSSNPFACSCKHPACTPAYPGTKALDQYLRTKYPGTGYGGLFCCRQNSAKTSVPQLSVHAIGRAIDLMVSQEGGDANNGIGDAVANWLVEHAEFIGIQRVIWDKAFWNGEKGFGLLSSASAPHTDHLHIELSVDGAAMKTPFFTSGAYTGVCEAHCEGTNVINSDCTSGDCAAYGADCLPGAPPKCGQPPPPEPPEAEAVPDAPAIAVTVEGSLARLSFVTPKRLFDTRQDALSADLTRGDGTSTGPLQAKSTSSYQSSNLPAGTSALWLNLTGISTGQPGFFSVFPSGAPPEISNLNLDAGGVRGNAVPAVLGSSGEVLFYALSEAEAIADLSGVFTPTGAGLTVTPPVRVLDTRSTAAPLIADTVQEIDVGAPAGATGVVATLTVIAGDAPGFVQAFPCGQAPTETSNINYAAGDVVANSVLSKLGDSGLLCVRSIKGVDLVVDVTGYLSPDGPLSYQALQPRRLLDTRSDTTPFKGRLGNGQVIELPIQSLAGMPAGVWAVVANITAVGATDAGFVTAYACGGDVPSTSSLNFPGGGAVGALSVAALGPDGGLCVYAHSRAHLLIDLLGVWVHDDSLAPPPPSGTPSEGEPDPVPPTKSAKGGTDSDAGCSISRLETDSAPAGLVLLLGALGLWWRRRPVAEAVRTSIRAPAPG